MPAPQTDDVDAVVLAVPAKAAARLLAGVARRTPRRRSGVLDYASVALVALALPPGTPLPELSGFLVPPTEGTLVKAATFFTRKWAHLRRDGGPVIVRASLGRAGEEERLQRDDAVARRTGARRAGRADRRAAAAAGRVLGAALGRRAAAVPAGPPRPGRRGRGPALPPGLALAGAAYDGVGIPACVASGETRRGGRR